MPSNKFDYKKTLEKFLRALTAIIIAGIVSIYGESQWFLAIAPMLPTLSNFLKHKYNLDLKII